MIATLFANAADPWPLRDGVVHVWRFACRQVLDARVTDDELRAAQRFATPGLRASYLVQRAMVRGLLARYLDAPVMLDRGPRGKPFIVDSDLELNLSHADDVALLAIARGFAVGVDIERLDVELDPAALAPVVLAPDEATCSADLRAFLRIWCRKEACLKAIGVGLVDDLTAISVLADRIELQGSSVELQDLSVSATHAAALATTRRCAKVSSTELEAMRL